MSTPIHPLAVRPGAAVQASSFGGIEIDTQLAAVFAIACLTLVATVWLLARTLNSSPG